MSGFQYFLPCKTKDQLCTGGKLNRDVLAELGLAERLSDLERVGAHFELLEVHGRVGPGNEQGTMLGPVSKQSGLPQPFGNWPLRQISRPIFVNGAIVCYVVSDKTELPRPHDLIRHAKYFGRTVVDRFGYEWEMPICRTPHAGRLGLPVVYTFDSDGSPNSQVQEDHAWAFDLSSELRAWFQAAFDGEEPKHEYPWVVEQALKLLALNYRIGKEEIALLAAAGYSFLTREFINELAYSSFDYALEEEAKKKPETTGEVGVENSSSSTPGEKADCQDTVPPSAA
jgi:hypothetical protein